MPILSKRAALAAMIETTQGTAVSASATDFLRAYDVQVQPMGEVLDQEYISTSLDPFASLIGKKHATVKFKTPLVGSGAAGTAPRIGVLFQACGMTETVVASTSVTYDPSSSPAANFYGAGKSCTLVFHAGDGTTNGPKIVVAGAMGNPKLAFEAGKIPYVEWEMSGTYAAVADAAFPTVTLDTTTPAVVKSATLTLQAYSATCSKMEIDFGNTVSERLDVNAANSLLGFMVTGRKPTGSADPEAVPVATHDFWGKFMSGATASSSIVIGSTAGNICTITLASTQYGQLAFGDRNGIATYETPLIFSRSSGDDWISIAFT